MQQSKIRNDEVPRISPICDVTRGGIRFFLLEDTLILTQLFKVTLNDTQPTYQLGTLCAVYSNARHTEPYLPSNAIILPEIVFTDKVINQRCSRVCYLYCIKKHETSSLQSSCSKSVNQEWFLACDVMAVFTDPCPFEGDSSSQGRSEHMQPGASVNHNCTVPLFVPLFTSVPLLFIFFFNSALWNACSTGWLMFTGATQLPCLALIPCVSY